MDVILLSAIVLGGFIVYMLYSGEVPLRFFGSIRRDKRPIIYWLFICFYIVVFGFVVYGWGDGARLPFSEMFK